MWKLITALLFGALHYELNYDPPTLASCVALSVLVFCVLWLAEAGIRGLRQRRRQAIHSRAERAART